MAAPKVAIIECDKETLIDIATKLQFAITGKKILFSDSMVDIVKRHCPDIYQFAADRGFRFIPSDDKDELVKRPPNICFDILAMTEAN